MNTLEFLGVISLPVWMLVVFRRQIIDIIQVQAFITSSYLPMEWKPIWLRIIEVRYFHSCMRDYGENMESRYKTTKADARLYLPLPRVGQNSRSAANNSNIQG